MNGDGNEAWELTAFVEAVTAELDQARDLSRVKARAGRPHTYLIKELVLDLHVFAEYDGRTVRFRTAGPNEEGASELHLELGSATAPVIEQTTKPPPTADDVGIDDLPIDQKTRENLRNIGVESKGDVERLRGIKVRTPKGDVDFARLADMMDRVSSAPRRPAVHDVVSFKTPGDGNRIRLLGENLGEISPKRVLLDGKAVTTSVTDDYIDVELPADDPGVRGAGELVLETHDGDRIRLLLESED